jgi:hypothetical protein
MTRPTSSSGLNEVLGISAEALLAQYAQSLRQALLYRTLRREMQRPSPENEWQTPEGAAEPRPLPEAPRALPLETQEASYFAEAARRARIHGPRGRLDSASGEG